MAEASFPMFRIADITGGAYGFSRESVTMRSFYNGGSICINPNICFKCFDSIKLLPEVTQKEVFVLSVKKCL